MKGRRRILLIADPAIPIPPPLYGGVERVVSMLADELPRRDYEVTLMAHPDSTSDVRRIALPSLGMGYVGRAKNALAVLREMTRANYDIVHSFGHPDLTVALWPFRQYQVQSFQSVPPPSVLRKRARLVPRKNVWFTTCGKHMVTKNFTDYAPTGAIHNCVPIEKFSFSESVPSDAPLVFLGRIESIKGTHHAIAVAKAVGRRLVIAGNISPNALSRSYFENRIQPHLSETITYVGEVNDAQKSDILGGAAAFLMPIEWDEPFGIVMAEALACGTPVLGFARGALPEIVTDGITGKYCLSIEELIEAARHPEIFSRHACRNAAESAFSHQVITNQYMDLYEEILK